MITRLINKHLLRLVLGLFYLMISAGISQAQIKPWNAINDPARFQILTSFNSEAVLDRETGLIWEKTPLSVRLGTGPQTYINARFNCNTADTGGRYGWRLPTFQELMSLRSTEPDPANNDTCLSPLPGGAHFLGDPGNNYWTSSPDNFPNAGAISFGHSTTNPPHVPTCSSPPIPVSSGGDSKSGTNNYWCVRGGSFDDTQ